MYCGGKTTKREEKDCGATLREEGYSEYVAYFRWQELDLHRKNSNTLCSNILKIFMTVGSPFAAQLFFEWS